VTAGEIVEMSRSAWIRSCAAFFLCVVCGAGAAATAEAQASSIDSSLKQEFPKKIASEAPLLNYSNPSKNADLEAYGRDLARRFKDNDMGAPLSPELSKGRELIHVDPGIIRAALESIQGKLGTASRWDEKRQYYSVLSLDLQLDGKEREQGLAGSCATFDSVGNLEAAYMRQMEIPIHFSEMWPIRLSLGESIAAGEYDPMSAPSDTRSLTPDPFSQGYYLGVFPEQLLGMVKSRGICRSEDYPYEADSVKSFESGKNGFGIKMSFDSIRESFASELGLRSDPRVSGCELGGKSLAAEMKDFHAIEVSNYDPEQIIHLLSFGIPIWTDVVNFQGGAGAHSVMITGYDRDKNRYKIRNSWGSLSGSNELSMASDIPIFSIIVTPSDVARACANPALAPTALAELCAKSAGK
jgi:hypothetical protein